MNRLNLILKVTIENFTDLGIAKLNKRSTLTWKDVETGVQIVVGEELAKHGTLEGRKSLQRSHSCCSNGKPCVLSVHHDYP